MSQEWEEKLTHSNELADSYKEKYENLKEKRNTEGYMDQARSFASKLNDSARMDGEEADISTMFNSVKNFATPAKAPSVTSFSSGLAQQAKTLVTQMNNLNCNGMNERNQPEPTRTPYKESPRSRTTRSFQEYSKSPKRAVDVW